MNLKSACKIGKAVGMTTIGESVDSIEHFSMSIFKYKDIQSELNEMYNDPLWDKLKLNRAYKIEKVLDNE